MKKIKYLVGEKENIGLVPYGAIIEVYLVNKGINGALVYMPKKLTWKKGKEKGTDRGCGSLSFAVFNDLKATWVKSNQDYLNLETNKYEKCI